MAPPVTATAGSHEQFKKEERLAGNVIQEQTDVKVKRMSGKQAIVGEGCLFYIFSGRKPWRVLPAYL